MSFRALFVTSIACLLFTACNKKDSPVPVAVKAINVVAFKEVSAGRSTISFNGDSILVSVPGNADLSSLTPVVTFQGVSVSPSGSAPIDFRNVVKFTVTGSDSTKKEYYVRVTRRASLYVGALTAFYALDTKDGGLLWQYASTANFAYSDPFVMGDTLFAGGIDGNMYALNARNGNVLWTKYFSSTGIEGPALVAGNTLYFGTNDDYFYALDPATGNTKWSYKTNNNISTKPVIFNNTVIFASSDGYVYALDTASGARAWRSSVGFVVSSSPVLHNGVIFIGSRDYAIYALDAATGTQKWAHSTGVSMEWSVCSIANGTVYAAGAYDWDSSPMTAGSLYALDEATGALKWESLKALGFSGALTLRNDTVYIPADDAYFYAVNGSTGTPLWSTYVAANGSAGILKDSVIYVPGGGTGYVYALNARNGLQIWSYSFGYNNYFTSDPALGRVARKRPFSISF